jgi:hypothetical protein
MDPIEKRELKRQAWQRLAAQRRRAGLLRGRVVAISLVCFALLWGIVFVQMATGNDPVLSAKEKTGRTTARATRRAHRHAPKAEVAGPRLEQVEAAPELEEEAVEPVEEEAVEPEFEEEVVEPVEEEPAFEEVEPEFVEEEPLVTSQS